MSQRQRPRHTARNTNHHTRALKSAPCANAQPRASPLVPTSSATPQLSDAATYSSANRKLTCHKWMQGTCNLEATCRYNAMHELFPVIVERAHQEGKTLVTCQHWLAGDCYYPAEYCGYAHEDLRGKGLTRPPMSPEERAREEHEIRKRNGLRPYFAKLMSVCKLCDAKFRGYDEVKEHCKEPTLCAERTVVRPFTHEAEGDVAHDSAIMLRSDAKESSTGYAACAELPLSGTGARATSIMCPRLGTDERPKGADAELEACESEDDDDDDGAGGVSLL